MQTAYVGIHIPQQTQAPKLLSNETQFPFLDNNFSSRPIDIQHVIKL